MRRWQPAGGEPVLSSRETLHDSGNESSERRHVVSGGSTIREFSEFLRRRRQPQFCGYVQVEPFGLRPVLSSFCRRAAEISRTASVTRTELESTVCEASA